MTWWAPQTWDWATLINAAVGAGFGTALVQALLTIYRDRHQRKLQAAYMGMRLAVILEEFVLKCLYRAWHDNADLTEGAHELDYNLPTLACYPQDSDWKSLDPKLAGQVLSFPNEVTSAGLSCQFQGTREGNKIASANETIVAGVNAWKLAQALRKKYKLGAITIQHIDFLLAEYNKIQRQREEYAERPQI